MGEACSPILVAIGGRLTLPPVVVTKRVARSQSSRKVATRLPGRNDGTGAGVTPGLAAAAATDNIIIVDKVQ